MSIRKFAIFNAALLLVSGAALAQNQPAVVEQSTTTKQTEVQHREDLFQSIGWEIAAVDGGVRIERITKNSPAAEAHLEEKDIITKIAGENVLSPERVSEVIAKVARDGEARTEVTVLREGEELSYLLPLEPVARVTGTTTTTTRTSQADLVQMIQQLQMESQQQRAMLEMLLSEVQTLRTQLGVAPNPRVGAVAPAAGTTTVTGDIVAPAGTAGVPFGTQPRTNAGQNPPVNSNNRPNNPQ